MVTIFLFRKFKVFIEKIKISIQIDSHFHFFNVNLCQGHFGPMSPCERRSLDQKWVIVDSPLDASLTKMMIFVRDFYTNRREHYYLYAVGDPEDDMIILP